MKNILKTIIKFTYCAVLPAIMIIALIRVTLGYTDFIPSSGPVYLVMVMTTILTVLNAVFYAAFMSSTKVVPKLGYEKWIGFGFGIGWADKNSKTFLFIIPFIIIELSW